MKYFLLLIFICSSALGQQLPTGPLQFVKDTKTVNVKQDTVTPSNSVGLPVNIVAGTVNATNPSVSTTGAAVPSSATFIGANKSGNLVAPTLDGSDNLNVNVQTSTLPTGAATESKQDTGNTSLGSIDGKITVVDTSNVNVTSAALPTNAATETSLSAVNSDTISINGKIPSGLTVLSNNLKVDGSAVTQPVSMASAPLPTGAATEAKQDTQITSLGTINTTLGTPFQAGGSIANTSFGISGTLPAFAATPTVNLGTISGVSTETTLSALNTKVPSNLTVTSTRLLVDPSGVTSPVSIAAAVQTKDSVNAGGSFFSASINSVTTITAPSNAVEVIIQADDTNTENMRFVIGGTATSSIGVQLQPGRSETLKVGSNISIIPESGTQKYNIQYVTQ